MNYGWHLLVLVSIYSILGTSLNLIVGSAGLLSLCHAAFYGFGAYLTALLVVDGGLSFFPALSIAVVGTGLVAWAIGHLCLRLRGDYFVLATIAVQAAVFGLLYNWISVTRGSLGITGIPRPAVLGVTLTAPIQFFALSGPCALMVVLLLYLVDRSPFGLVLKAVRDDEVAAVSLGRKPRTFLAASFGIGGALAALAGGLLGTYLQYLDPTSFTLGESIAILSVVIVGGAGSLVGSILGAILIVGLPEALRFLRLPEVAAASLRQMIFGLMLVVLMRVRPSGLKGRYDFS